MNSNINNTSSIQISCEKLKSNFVQAANSLTVFYKESLKAQSEAYLQGQIDALNEILDYSLKKYNGDIRNIPTSAMLEFIKMKIMELNEKKNNEIFKDNKNANHNFPNTIQNEYMPFQINDQTRFNPSSQFNK